MSKESNRRRRSGRNRLGIREMQLAPAIGWSYSEALRHKNEWLDIPPFIRGNKTFAIHLEALLSG